MSKRIGTILVLVTLIVAAFGNQPQQLRAICTHFRIRRSARRKINPTAVRATQQDTESHTAGASETVR